MEDLWGNKAPSTWNIAVAAMTDWSKQLIRDGKRTIPLLPDHVGFKKIPSRLPKPVPEEEISQLLRDVTDLQDILLFEILSGSGLRASEVANLRFSNINTQGIIQVIGKGDKERQTFMTDAAMDALKAWTVFGPHMGYEPGTLNLMEREQMYWTFALGNPHTGIFLNSKDKPVIDMDSPYHWVYYRVTKYTKRSPHTFRHFWVTDLLNNGADLMAVMDAAGHESIKTTRIYKKVLNRETTSLRNKHSRQQGRL